MVADLVVWHETVRVGHEEAAEKAAGFMAKRAAGGAAADSVPAFMEELTRNFPGVGVKGDRKSFVLVTLGDAPVAKVVPVVRYLAAKHRLACFDVRLRAVVNPPLLRRIDAPELTSAGDLPIEDPSADHIERAVRELDGDFWFVILDFDDDHYVQGGLGERAGAAPGAYMLEVRDGDEHLQTEVADADAVISAFREHAAGETAWRERFSWRPVAVG
ncbi:hypothetical protein F4553_003582 [Allocatelliglobosispora scoriae]|uniref:Uncharacterized protein n=1 Tax=Allocatelliglobosispora scoriae TaxID=643052 RepID=A0A841BTF9_9ACTN|nr:hypothetical protein [Allocatelliglobosispora scoriae]MBB5870203.1 hypothetical protein [Allocatelliglobosispora scoriae]